MVVCYNVYMADNQFEKLNWSALEYEEKERSTDWFWALGVIVVAGAITAIIFNNYFFALFLIISGLLLGLFAIKKPEMVDYELNLKGFQIKNRLFPYEKIQGFWVQTELPNKTDVKPTLFIKSERKFLPVLSIPINLELANQIKRIMMLKKVPEIEMHEHPSDGIMEYLGF